MEAAEENGGSVTVDLNENEEEAGGGTALKARSRALLAGVGDPARGHGGTGSVQTEDRLDVARPEGCLPDRLGLHSGMNGFAEPVLLEGGGPGRSSGEIQGDPRDSCSAAQGEEAAGGGRAGNPQLGCGCSQAALPDTNMPNGVVDSPESDLRCFYPPSFPDHRLSGCEEVKVANGGLHIRASCDCPEEEAECPGEDAECPEQDAECPGEDAECPGEEAECPEQDAECPGEEAECPEQDAECPGEDAECPEEDAECPGEEAECPEQDAECPGEDAGCPTEDHDCSREDAECSREDIKLPVSVGPSTEDPPTLGSSANLPSPSLSTHSDLASDSPLSEPDTREDEEDDEDEDGDFRDLSLPVRPQSLRTNPNLTVSLSCDATPLSPDEDGGFYFGGAGYEEDIRFMLEAGRRQSAPDNLPDLSDQADDSDPKLMPKRFGIADFFTRSLFSRKAKEPRATTHNAAGWRLFGKTAIREDEQAKEPASPVTSQSPQREPEMDPSCPQRPPAAGRRKNLEFEPLSTTALILEDRPANLPAKSMEETQRHKLEYEEMVAGAKRRELKEAQRKKRQMKERHRQEDIISNAMVVWNTEILPHWDSMKSTRRVRDLWWQGLPPSVRGRVWSLAIGNELNITAELYEIFLSRAKEKWRSYSETSSVNDSESDGGASLADRESSLDLIKLDISRTFPSLFIFQKGGPYHDLLHSVLGAYTCYRPDIGYVQGMSFIAAVLILNLEEAEAFITFANLLNKPCQMAFFRVDHELMLKYFAAFEIFFEENLPRLFSHFQTNNLTPDLYLIDWIFTLYSKSLPLDVACRVWDVFCRDGEESLFRTGLGVLRLFQDVLLQMDFIHIAQFLTRLPEDLQAHTLFNAMANTHMISRNRRWAQVFTALTKDGGRETEKSSSSPALRS